jgi:hypothetical protein
VDRQSTLTQLRAALVERADPAHARFHQAYHKSTQRFYGLRTPQLRAVWREVWPGRAPLPRAAVLPLLDPLWAGGSFEEAATALHLLGRAAGQLTAADLPLLHAQTRRCAGWGLLDALAIGCLGPLALARGAEIHAPVMRC